jgi:hypothetical protein
MQFMMLMIPAVYQGRKKVDPGFVPDPKKMEEMTKFNEELGKTVKIISLNGLHPLATGARGFYLIDQGGKTDALIDEHPVYAQLSVFSLTKAKI